MPAHCHKMIAATAKEMAGALYEELAKDNNWPKVNPDLRNGESHTIAQRRFIARNWGKLIPQARSTLTDMLKGNYSDDLKEEILDALIKDASLMRGRNRGR